MRPRGNMGRASRLNVFSISRSASQSVISVIARSLIAARIKSLLNFLRAPGTFADVGSVWSIAPVHVHRFEVWFSSLIFGISILIDLVRQRRAARFADGAR